MTERTHPPRLISLELQGYKSFASKTLFEFGSTITAVVGPNGSGKSNIADAIRWVLGEQAYSLLRGRKTEDMIFAGSDSRARAGMALASITFDNRDGWLPIDYSEVSISRRAYRDGQNEYLVNDQRVRLRDVSELLAASGLAERTYTVIGQGLVDAVLSLKAAERRALFEEAAGIGLHRTRREEAVRRLEATRRNLDRAQDILAEVRPRVRSLERQAKRVEAYEQVRSDLQGALREWYGYHWYRLQDIVQEAQAAASAAETSRAELLAEQESHGEKLEALHQRVRGLREEREVASQHLGEIRDTRERVGRQLAVAEARQEWLQDSVGEGKEDLQGRLRSREVLLERLEAARRVVEGQDFEDEKVEVMSFASIEAPDEDVPESSLESLRELLEQERELDIAMRVVEERISELEASSRNIGDGVAGRERDLEKLKHRLVDLDEAIGELEAAGSRDMSRVEELEGQIGLLEATREKVDSQRIELRSEAAGLEAQMDALRQLGEAVGGGKDLEIVARQLGLEGWAGALLANLEVEARYRMALLAALGEFQSGYLVEGKEQVDRLLSWMEGEEGVNGAAILPSEGGVHDIGGWEVPGIPGVIGLASDLVRVSGKLSRSRLQQVLGRVLVVEDRRAARQALPLLPVGGKVVTLGGEAFYPEGGVVVYRGDAEKLPDLEEVGEEHEEIRSRLNSLERERLELDRRLQQTRSERDQLSKSLKERQQRIEELSRHRRELQAEVRGQEARLEDLRREGASYRQRIEARLEESDDLQASREGLRARRRAVEAALQESGVDLPRVGLELEALSASGRLDREDLISQTSAWEEELARIEGAIAERQDRLDRFERERVDLQGDIKRLRARMEGLARELEDLEGEMRTLEGELREAIRRRSELEAGESTLRAQIRLADQRYTTAQIDLARKQEELSGMEHRIVDDFGLVSFEYEEAPDVQDPLPLEGYVEHLPRVEEISLELEDQVNHLRSQLRRMGSVNPEAQQEYREVKERKEFLENQIGDLREAEGQLVEVIDELDALMAREFQKTFEEVEGVFRGYFTRLFGGGHARLILAQGEDLSETGIDIEVKLPGRREQGLAVLSGGERSLTACALIFSLLRVSPTPFCVLDEVDAMLDESNTVRFSEILRELSRETQFLIITHNRHTIQQAEVIYGISLGADTASKVIGLKLDEAERQLAA